MTESRPSIAPASREPLLHGELPHTRAFSFEPLLHGPTPVTPLDALSGWLGRGDVYAKRDDLAHPLYGGNKVRKFEWLLGEARARGATDLVALGAIASTQVTATATLGRALGYRVHAVLFEQPMTAFARRAVRANHAVGLAQTFGGSMPAAAVRALRLHRQLGASSFAMLPGASTPLPNLGFIDAALEVGEQVRRGEAPRPDAVIVPAGTCGTAVGLAIGFRLLGWDTEVVAVRIAPRAGCNEGLVKLVDYLTVRAISRRSPRFAGRLRGGARVTMDHAACGEGYGFPTPEAIDGAARLAAITGYPGEITYTGKALAAVKRLAGGRLAKARSIWVWNTLTQRPPEGEGIDEAALPADLAALLRRPLVA